MLKYIIAGITGYWAWGRYQAGTKKGLKVADIFAIETIMEPVDKIPKKPAKATVKLGPNGLPVVPKAVALKNYDPDAQMEPDFIKNWKENYRQ